MTCIPWLPHSLDSGRTWLAFWSYLGLACSFWAIRDWLLGKSEAEERAERRRPEPGGDRSGPFLPARLRRLLWVLTVNGGLLGVEGIAQRLEGSGKLLFLVKPRVNPGAVTQFGPYAYRANASQYFNLLWPVCLGFWWILNQSLSSTRKWHHLILVCCAIMAACPMISTSRGGALITAGIIVLAAFFLLAAHFLLAAQRQPERGPRKATLVWLLLFFCGALALGYGLGWKALEAAHGAHWRRLPIPRANVLCGPSDGCGLSAVWHRPRHVRIRLSALPACHQYLLAGAIA